MLANGPIPPGMFVCHKCDNRRCVNPDHLFLGLNRDNVDDMVRKGRQCRGASRSAFAPKGSSHKMARLTEADAASIYADARRYKDIAADYGVALSTVGYIKTKATWKHIHGA